MSGFGAYKKLLYQYEVLRSRLQLREHYLSTFVKNEYERIGQDLLLVRVKLSLLKGEPYNVETERIDETNDLLGNIFKDLSDMRKRLYPESGLLTVINLSKAIQKLIQNTTPKFDCDIVSRLADSESIDSNKAVLFIVILSDVLILLKNTPCKHSIVNIIFIESNVEVSILYSGNEINIDQIISGSSVQSSITERVELADGVLETKKLEAEQIMFKLVIPIR